MRETEVWDGVHFELPEDPSECARQIIRVGKWLVKNVDSTDEELQRERTQYCDFAKWHLQTHHSKTWKALNQEYDLVSYGKRTGTSDYSEVDPKGKSTQPPAAKAIRKRTTSDEKAIERRNLLELPMEELLTLVVESPDQLVAFCKAPDSYGVLALRLVIEICRPDCTAGVVLSQILYWHCRSRHGRPRIGKQGWLRKTHADLAAETGLTKDQVRGALERLEKTGLCERRRGCRTGLLNPCLQEIARRAWAAIDRGEPGR